MAGSMEVAAPVAEVWEGGQHKLGGGSSGGEEGGGIR